MQTHRHTETGNGVFGTYAIVTVSTTAHTGKAGDISLPRNLVVITDWTDIDRFADPTKNILLYPWTPSPLLHQTIATRSLSDLPRLRFILPTKHLAGAASIVEDDLARRLFKELTPALIAFASIVPSPSVELSLMKTTDQSCPLFHTDRFPVRLLCTLHGPGTEWLDDEQVNRKGLGRGDNRKVAGPEATIYAAQPFQILILKGDNGFGTASTGAVHRSPTLPASSDGRWYLRIDPVFTSRPAIHEWSRL